LVFSNTTTAGGDTGAHFIVPYFAKSEFFNHFQIAGWTPIWYDGFPLFTFYFPLPSIVIALLSSVIPYDVAFKLITLAGSFALPLVTYYLGKSLKFREPYPTLLAMGSVAYLFDRTYTIDGGNLASTLAGEYAFSFSLALGIAFLAVVVGGLHSKRRVAIAGLLYGLTALSHLLPAFFVAALALVYVLLGRKFRDLVRLGVAGLIGVALIALWLVPFAENIYYTTSMGWTKVTTYVTSLAPDSLRPWIYLALLGAVIAFARRRRFTMTLAVAGLVSVVAFVVFPQGAVYNARMLPFYVLCVYLLAASAIAEVVLGIPRILLVLRRTAMPSDLIASEISVTSEERGSIEPLLSTEPLADEEAIASSLDHTISLVELRRSRRRAGILGVVGMAVILLIGVYAPLANLPSWLQSHVTQSFVPSWAEWNYSGYEAKPGWPEYQRIMATMSALGNAQGCGRAMWEYNANQNNFGTPMALMLLPYWTNGCIDSMEGLFFESSATTPYHFLNQSELSAAPSEAMSGLPYIGLDVPLGIQHLQLLGVRYYMAYSPSVVQLAMDNPNLTLVRRIAAVDPSASNSSVLGDTWYVFKVKGSQIVQPLTHAPVVWSGMRGGKSSWLQYSVAWYDQPSTWDVFRAQSGPSNWRRIAPGGSAPSESKLPTSKVSDVKVGTDSVSFTASTIGVPTLVKVSYFPNWHAVGALGPYRVTPNLMVVVPTSHHVSLVYQNSTLDSATKAISLAVLLGIVVVAVLPSDPKSARLRRRAKASTASV
jgi:hypothetical protein